MASKPCIEFAGARANGYGVKKVGKKVVYVHRLAYCEHHGITMESIKGKQVRHDCDNPPCIEPTHLLLGTNADNSEDKVLRDRQSKKLTAAQVAEIRRRFTPGFNPDNQTALAKEFGVTQVHISRIVRGVSRTMTPETIAAKRQPQGTT